MNRVSTQPLDQLLAIVISIWHAVRGCLDGDSARIRFQGSKNEEWGNLLEIFVKNMEVLYENWSKLMKLLNLNKKLIKKMSKIILKN